MRATMISSIETGFDAVECIISIEDTFNISIPDRDAERLRSVSDLTCYVVTRIHPGTASGTTCPPAMAFRELRRRFNSGRTDANLVFRPSTATVALLRPGDRREAWHELGERLDIRLPSLCFGPVWRCAILAICPLALVVGGVWGWALAGTTGAVGWSITAFVISIYLLCFIGPILKSLWAKNIPPMARTVGDLAYIHFLQSMKARPAAEWSEDDVRIAVRYLISQSAGLSPRLIRQDTTFLELNAIERSHLH
jgi:hypothetical protein